MTCAACRWVSTTRHLCQFCSQTVRLIKEDRCVSCRGPVWPADTSRIEGRCAECRSRGVVSGTATRYLLHLAAKARHRATA